jgi:monoamine oxidase
LFVPRSHELTRRYARQFGIALEPAFPLLETRLYYFRGERSSVNPTKALWARYVIGALGELDSRRGALDALSAAEFLRRRGASAEELALLDAGYLALFADGMESYSALQLLERARALQAAGGEDRIRGGSDTLAHAFAARLAGRIRYGMRVERIEADEKQAAVRVVEQGRMQWLRAERIVCTLPFAVLRTLELAAPCSAAKMRAIAELPYSSVTRVFLQFARKQWTQENLTVLTLADLPFRWFYDQTANQPGSRGILEAQAFGADARRLGGMSEGARIAAALAGVEEIFPGARMHFERAVSKVWDEDPSARGAFAYFRPGQVSAFGTALAAAEGRVHFAGEHTSPWPGWMQGALHSGVRAAREISEALA